MIRLTMFVRSTARLLTCSPDHAFTGSKVYDLALLNLRLLLPVLLLFMPGVCFPQHYYSHNYTVNDGLPSNIVHSIMKDSRGILWIGTGGGLCRFDGTVFQVYNSTHGLVGDNVYSIAEDKNGDLWIGCMAAGISRFNGKKFYNYSTKQGLVSNDVREVWYSKKFDCLMIGTNDGCSAFQNGRFINFTVHGWNPEATKAHVMGFMEAPASVYVFNYGGPAMAIYNPVRKSYSHTEASKRFYASSVSPLILSTGDTMFGVGRTGVAVNSSKGSRIFDGLGQVFGLSPDNRGNVWIAGWDDPMANRYANSGLFKFDGRSVERLSDKVGITDPSVWTVYYDTCFSQLWVGTLNQGLYKIPDPFVAYYDNAYFHVRKLHVNDLQFDNSGDLWIAFNDGLIRMHSDGNYEKIDTGELIKIQKRGLIENFSSINGSMLDKEGSFEKYEALIRNGKYPYPNPYRLINTEFGSTHIAGPGSRYNPNGYYQSFKRLKQGLEMKSFLDYDDQKSCLGKDSRGNIYFGNFDFFFRFKERGQFRKPEFFPMFSYAEVFAIDNADTLYFGSIWVKGVFKAALFPAPYYAQHCYYDWVEDKGPPGILCAAAKGNETWFGSRYQGLFRIVNGRCDAFNVMDPTLPKIINAICFDRQGHVIAGGINGEIIIGKTEADRLSVIHRISPKDGLMGTNIQWMATGPGNMLYAGTNKGLNRIDLNRLYREKVLQISFYDQDEGYFDYSGTTAGMDGDSNIWVGTASHLLKIDTRKLATRKIPAMDLKITSLDVNYRKFNFPRKSDTNYWTDFPNIPWKFNHNENSITFYFEASDISNPDHMRYRFRLDGLTSHWTPYSPDKEAVFTNLSPGRYRFMAECYNMSDNLSISHIEYAFTILTPWYRTWWFLMISISLIIVSVFLLFQWRVRRIKLQEQKRNALLLDISKLEMKALQAQMKPHFIFNAINSMQGYILNNDIDKALYYLNMFSKLIRKTLESASKEFVPLIEELDYLTCYIEIEKMRFGDLFDYEMNISPDVPLETTLIPPLIVQLFVENAIKHGLMHRKEGGHLIIELLREKDNMFKMVVQDNGVGRKRAEEMKGNLKGDHRSLGLQITRDRIKILNETRRTTTFNILFTDLENSDGSSAGVRVEFWFPEIGA